MTPTRFSVVYNSFLSKITDDMYLQLTEEDTIKLLRELLMSAIPKFEFPRQSLDFDYRIEYEKPHSHQCHCRIIWQDFEGVEEYTLSEEDGIDQDTIVFQGWTFTHTLTYEEVNILATYMIVEWLGQQLASVENVRMKYSGSDFKFTSQANHMQKLLQMKKDYDREGFHLQRLYKRRIKDENGIYHSTMSKIMEPVRESFNFYSKNPKQEEQEKEDKDDCDCNPLEWEDI